MTVLIEKTTPVYHKNTYASVYLHITIIKDSDFLILSGCLILTNYQYTLIKDVTF
jgi:pantothenate kinase